MKKSIFMLAAMIAATFANAQITLLHTFENQINFGWGIAILEGGRYGDHGIVGNFIYEEDEDLGIINIYNANDGSLYKTITKKAGCSYTLLSRGIFTADNKWSFVTYERSNTIGWEDCSFEDCKYYYTIKIQTEYGETLATLSTNAFCEDLVTLVKVENAYKLLVKNNTKYDFYSLPGNGEAQDVETPSAPRKSARKVLKKDQVYIESPDHIYDTQGKMVR